MTAAFLWPFTIAFLADLASNEFSLLAGSWHGVECYPLLPCWDEERKSKNFVFNRRETTVRTLKPYVFMLYVFNFLG